MRKKTGPKPNPELTLRQTEIMKLLATGSNDKDVACKLDCSVHTAHFHRHQIFKKLKVHSSVELVHYALRKQLIPLMEF